MYHVAVSFEDQLRVARHFKGHPPRIYKSRYQTQSSEQKFDRHSSHKIFQYCAQLHTNELSALPAVARRNIPAKDFCVYPVSAIFDQALSLK